jgi:hypothetical protein
MSSIVWIMLPVLLIGFAAGYGVRSYVSVRRRARERRSRLQTMPSTHRTLTLNENTEVIEKNHAA